MACGMAILAMTRHGRDARGTSSITPTAIKTGTSRAFCRDGGDAAAAGVEGAK